MTGKSRAWQAAPVVVKITYPNRILAQDWYRSSFSHSNISWHCVRNRIRWDHGGQSLAAVHLRWSSLQGELSQNAPEFKQQRTHATSHNAMQTQFLI
jgi:hypothetical protein